MPSVVNRRTFITAALTALGGCTLLPGESPPRGENNPAFGPVSQIGDLTISSPAILDNGRIPNRYGHFFEDINPPLHIRNAPRDAEALVLVFDGPDAPDGEFTHWLVWNIPPDVERIPAGWDPPPPAVEGGNGYGNIDYGYVGPDPPNKQTYRFKLFALNTLLDLPRGTGKITLGRAIRGRITEQTQLTAWYDFHSVAHDNIPK